MDKKTTELYDRIFAHEGILSKVFANYEPRQEQIELSKKIYTSFEHETHLLAEAGTGTGKSFAYLIAAALWSLQNDKTVLISTNTLPLQNQLIEKDLPIVAEVMRELGYSNFRYELAKGRGHYICKRRLENYIQETLRKESPYRDLVEKIALQSYDAKTGLREEFPFSIPNDVWEEICGDSDDCFHQYSPFYDHCFIQQARMRWTKAHVIIANHALVFSDIALKTENDTGVLPKYDRLLFDEGHRVEEVFSRYFERTLSLPYLEQLFRTIRTRKHGWMRTVLDEEMIENIEQFHKQIREQIQPLFEKLAEELSHEQEKKGYSSLQPVMELIEKPISIETDIENSVQALHEYLHFIYEQHCTEEQEKRGMQILKKRISAIAEDLRFILHRQGGDDWAHWIEKTPPANAGIFDPQAEWIKLIAQPIHAKTVFRELFSRIPVTFLSATMAAGKSFHFLAQRLGIDRYDQFIVGSPFDYRNNALLVVSETSPDPKDEAAFVEFVAENLKRILSITKGRTLVLFTSFVMLETVAKKIQSWVEEQGINLLLHLPQFERDVLIQQFKNGSRNVLFGCESFWEGIDIPGEALSCVVLTKLPFANPSEPLVRAKIQAIEQRGGNSFVEYMIPNVILRTKQGVGRLIRTTTDRGAIVIMDSRIVHKYYGKKIIESLPPARRGKLKEIINYVPKDL